MSGEVVSKTTFYDLTLMTPRDVVDLDSLFIPS